MESQLTASEKQQFRSGSPVKQGWLTKEPVSGAFGANKRRWISLVNRSLQWREEASSEMLGKLILGSDTEIKLERITNTLTIRSGLRVLVLHPAAETPPSEMQSWFHKLDQVKADHLQNTTDSHDHSEGCKMRRSGDPVEESRMRRSGSSPYQHPARGDVVDTSFLHTAMVKWCSDSSLSSRQSRYSNRAIPIA